MATTTVENKELARDVVDAFNDHDSDALTDLFADDLVFHRPLEELHGIEEFNDYVQEGYDAFPDITLTIEELVAEDDMVVARYTGTATHEGEYKGIDPTGEEVQLSGMRMVRVEDGEIVEVWAQENDLGRLVQLGVIEPPAE